MKSFNYISKIKIYETNKYYGLGHKYESHKHNSNFNKIFFYFKIC